MTRSRSFSQHKTARLKQLKQLMGTDTSPKALFDEIIKLACEVCDTTIGLVSLADDNQLAFKAHIGLKNISKTPQALDFCKHAMLMQPILEIEDATKDARFLDSPLVTHAPHVRFYAGATITLPNKLNVGTLCVMDRLPKKLNAFQRNTLMSLAHIASKALRMQEDALNLMQSKSTKLAAIIEDSDDAIISKSLDSIVTSWNKSAERIFGYTAEEIVGRPITRLFPKDRVDEEKFLIKKIKNNLRIKHYETERLDKAGKRIQISVSLSPIKNALGEIVGVSKIARDITQQKLLEKKLSNEHERLRVTMDSIGDAVITTDKKGYVQYLNPIAQALTGWHLHDAVNMPLPSVFNIINAETKMPAVNPVESCLSKDRIAGLAQHTTLISRDGTEYGIEDSASPIHDAEGNTIGVVLVFRDVTVQRKMADEISYRATHDMLTGLVNRSELEKKLHHFIKDNRETDLQNAFMYIDLDRFKVVNDSCGHFAGDVVLKEATKIMQSCIRSTDTLARIGGDEFATILYKCDTEQAMKIAKEICKSIEQYRFHHGSECFRIGASIGLVMIDKNWPSTTSLMQAADNACYEAKEAGRNRVHLYYDDDNLTSTLRDDTKWVSRIEKALEEKSFVLFCQRIMPLKHQGLEHAEILIRLKDKDGSLIPPNAFLPSAERFHLASRIDRMVINEVFAWMQVNDQSLGHIGSISVNLSGQSLSDPTFHRDVLDLIATTPIDFKKLCFEITETAAITNIADAKKFIAEIHQYGVKFALDDFGSGVSSFGYLKNLNVDYLKIDGQFITDLLKNEIGQATVRCIAEVAKVTGKKTIAEWVENKTVENMLKKMGIDFTQGFLKHNPAPLDFLTETNCSYLSKNHTHKQKPSKAIAA